MQTLHARLFGAFVVHCILCLLAGTAQAAEGAAAVPVVLAPQGGWASEFEVRFTGPFKGTLEDAPTHPLAQSREAALKFAAQQGLAAKWSSSSLSYAGPPDASAGVLWIEHGYLHPDGGFNMQDSQENISYVARFSVALPGGTAEQRDELSGMLRAIPSVKLEGSWPLEGLAAARIPQQFTPRAVMVNGTAYQWPADFSLEEQADLWTYFAHWYMGGSNEFDGDMYFVNNKLQRHPRFGAGPVIRARSAPGAPAVIDNARFAETVEGWPLLGDDEVHLQVSAAEADLPLDFERLLRDYAERTLKQRLGRGISGFDRHGSGYRAVVELEAAQAELQVQQLNVLLAQWSAGWPQLAATALGQPSLVESGIVRSPDGQRAQWQASAWTSSPAVGGSLRDALTGAGVALAGFGQVTMPPAVVDKSAAAPIDRWNRYKVDIVYRLAPRNPHGDDSELLARRLSKDELAVLSAQRDAMRTAFTAWLAEQPAEIGGDSDELVYRLQDHTDQWGVTKDIHIAALDWAEAERIRAVLAPIQPAEPELTERDPSYYYNEPRGMGLEWELFGPANLRGVLPEAVEQQLGEAVTTYRQQAEAAAAALAQWKVIAQEADAALVKLRVSKYGGVPRVLRISTPYKAGSPELQSLQLALGAALPEAGAAVERKPGDYSFEPQHVREQLSGPESWERQLIDVRLVPYERTASWDAAQFPELFTAAELAAFEAQVQQIEAAVAGWNAGQAEADRVAVETVRRGEVPVSVSITGTQPTIERIESLGAALELPGLPVYRYGSAFMTRHHHQYSTAKQQRRATRAKLSYALVPMVYQVVYAYDGFDAALARAFTPQELEAKAQVPAQVEAALREFAAQRSGLSVAVEQQHTQAYADGSLVLRRQGQPGQLPRVLQVEIWLEDEQQRAQLEAELETWLAARVPGLPQRDTSGSIMIF